MTNPAAPAEHSDVHGKALSLNLEGSVYGTFAEIGAGQEVARRFLRVGAASGTVAKTICAYDKTVSDEKRRSRRECRPRARASAPYASK